MILLNNTIKELINCLTNIEIYDIYDRVSFAGTSACNGDSGGGFHVFIPDVTGNDLANATGAWYVYGIVSLSVSRRDMPVCDPNQYVVFTKIAEYRGWIQKYVK